MCAKNGLADLVRDEIQPDLAQKGFARNGLIFLRELQDVWLVGFQKSRSSTHDMISFTVNLGMASKRILRLLGGPRSVTTSGGHCPAPRPWPRSCCC